MSDEAGAGATGDQGTVPAATVEAPAAAVPAWQTALSDDALRGDATLARYQSVEELAKGLIENRRIASSRFVVPGADADAAAMTAFYDQIGRPKDAKEYDIPVPEGHPAERAEQFRSFAHGIGLRPEQAKALAEFENQSVQAELDRVKTASEADLAAFKAATPEYDAKLAATEAMLKSLGVSEATVQDLDVKLGTKELMTFMFGLAGKFGEAPRVDGQGGGGGLGGGDVTDAAGQLRTLDASAEWRDKIRNGDPGALAKRRALLAAANAQKGG